jgi:hypothetical protein
VREKIAIALELLELGLFEKTNKNIYPGKGN